MVDKSNFAWPAGRQAAVSLTYDDALKVHHERVAPAWEAQGQRVTFYTNILSLIDNPEPWRATAAAGHELGNHSVFHPCRKDFPDRMGWLPDEYDLRTYTSRRWLDEMRVANAMLKQLDGHESRSFGNTCCHTEIGTGSTAEPLDGLIEQLFIAGRGPGNRRVVDVRTINYNALGHFSGDQKPFSVLREEIDSAERSGGWIIYMIHGVGSGSHKLFIDDAEHDALMKYVRERHDTLWVAPVREVVTYLKECEDI